jgi:tetratricopeptide (TPR) repeat protein
MIQQAFISGQIGQVIYTDDDRYFVLNVEQLEEPIECRPMDLSMFFNYGAEFTTLSGAQLDLSQLRNQLVVQRQAYLALTLIISGMDEELDDESRTAALEAAERHLAEEFAHRFVRARMLGRPLPEEADIEPALNIAVRCAATSVADLYLNIIDCKQAIDLVYQTWVEAAPDYFSSFDERIEAERLLIDLGVFAEMASDLAAGNLKALSSVVITYGQRPEISKLRQGVLILNDLKTRLAKKWAVPLTKNRIGKKERRIMAETEQVGQGADPVREILARFKHRKEHPRSRTLSADEAKNKVDHQIEAIGKLIQQGNINRANRYLRDLIDFHVEHSEREHLGMSLCSLAKVAIDAQAFEIAEKMVNYALMLGIEDVFISNTQAQMMKAMGRFDEALATYEEAMARFPNNEVARNGYAEVLKAIGRFDEALAIYKETMTRFPNDEVARSGYAEVLKAMGRFDEALATYEEAMARFPNDEVARNGYAEVLKAMGRFDEALATYEEVMARFPNDEVARNGYASVLMLVNKFTEARSLLPDTRLSSKDDWIYYHIKAMSYLKSGDIDEGIRRLAYGLENTPWFTIKTYFANALGVANIKKQQFAEVLEVLPSNVVSLDVFQKQTRLALRGHALAALGQQAEAIQTLAQLEQAANPRIINLRESIIHRYSLGQHSATSPSPIVTSALDTRIAEEEFFLVMAA